ncbi:hypothetical protein EYZ11_010417 [Aspergillus tanneri]|uniref:Uncharacterized protein n=1 Tax=Aspergillus tanneri TaxID=1220188 RepID=A0A4S3J7I7_9EURO|nr:hypothetical protein EYZ11_010417 [Aspergillus tanneri]
MKTSFIEIFLLLACSASADFISTTRLPHHCSNVELGGLTDMQGFCLVSEQPYGSQNGSYEWEDMTKFETFDKVHFSPDTYVSISRCENELDVFIGIVQRFSDHMPSRNWFRGVGGAILLYFSPRLLTYFLNLEGICEEYGEMALLDPMALTRQRAQYMDFRSKPLSEGEL